LERGGSRLLGMYFDRVAPHIGAALGVCLMRQFMWGFPYELEDAARVDGGQNS